MMKASLGARGDVALLVSRVIVGGIFIYSGWLKVSAME